MDNNKRYQAIVESIYRKIELYKELIKLSSHPNQRIYYQNKINSEKMKLNYWENNYYSRVEDKDNQLNNKRTLNQRDMLEQRVFTIEELAQYDGANGRAAYVAVNNIVYDVSLVSAWGGGTHFGLYAGKDLSAQFNGCHGQELKILNELPEVGILQE